MEQIRTIIAILKSDTRGVTAMEYGIIAGVLGALIVTAFTAFGTKLSTALNAVNMT